MQVKFRILVADKARLRGEEKNQAANGFPFVINLRSAIS